MSGLLKESPHHLHKRATKDINAEKNTCFGGKHAQKKRQY